MLTRLALTSLTLLAISCRSPLVVGYTPPDPTDAGLVNGLSDEFPMDAPLLAPLSQPDAVSVAFDGQVHLLAWVTSEGLRARRYGLDGTALDAQPLLLAPPSGVDGASVSVMAQAGGGFLVYWAATGLLSGSSVPNGYSSLWSVVVSREGRIGANTVVSTLPSQTYPVSAAGEVPFQPGRPLVRFLTLASGATTAIIGESPYGADGCPTGFEVNLGATLGTPAYAAVNGRDYVAAFVAEAAGPALLVKLMGPRSGVPPQVCTDDGVVVLHVPLVGDADLLAGFHSLAMVGVGDRAVVLWRDGQRTGTQFTALYGASVRATGPATFEVSAPVTLGQRNTPAWVAPVLAATDGTVVYAAVRGVASDSTDDTAPLLLRLAPETLQTLGAVQGTTEVLGLNGAMRALDWDGAHLFAVLDTTGTLFYPSTGVGLVLGDVLEAPDASHLVYGEENEERVPQLNCLGFSCVASWFDYREMLVSATYGIHFDAAHGTVLDATAFKVAGNGVSQRAVAQLATGTLIAESAGNDTGCQLTLRLIPTTGPAPAPQVFPFELAHCVDAQSLRVVTTPTATYLAALFYAGPGEVRLLRVTPDGVASVVPVSMPLELTAHAGGLHAALVGDQLMLVVASSFTTLAVVSFDAATGAQLADPVVHELSRPANVQEAPLFGVGAAAGRAVVIWADPDEASGDYALRSLELDPATGQALAAPTAVLTGHGTVEGLAVASDGQRLQFVYGRRTFPSEPVELALRRYGAGGASLGPEHLLATGLTEPFVDLAANGPGRWVALYERHGQQQGSVISAHAQASRIVARLIYDGD